MKQVNKVSKVGITGTRQGMSSEQRKALYEILTGIHPKELHMGDCIGVDAEAAIMAKGLGVRIVSHPPISTKYRAFVAYDEERPVAEYLVRNERIVNETELLIGVPRTHREQLRSGTWACIRYARKIRRMTCIIYPRGNVGIEGFDNP